MWRRRLLSFAKPKRLHTLASNVYFIDVWTNIRKPGSSKGITSTVASYFTFPFYTVAINCCKQCVWKTQHYDLLKEATNRKKSAWFSKSMLPRPSMHILHLNSAEIDEITQDTILFLSAWLHPFSALPLIVVVVVFSSSSKCFFLLFNIQYCSLCNTLFSTLAFFIFFNSCGDFIYILKALLACGSIMATIRLSRQQYFTPIFYQPSCHPKKCDSAYNSSRIPDFFLVLAYPIGEKWRGKLSRFVIQTYIYIH